MATTDRLLYISSDGLVRQLGFDPAAADLGGAAGVASSTHSATSKTTPVDADELPIVDSEGSWSLKKLTWANLKATLATWIGGGTIAGAFTTVTASGVSSFSSKLVQGATASYNGSGGWSRGMQVYGNGGSIYAGAYSNDANAGQWGFSKSRNATVGSHTIVNSGDLLGAIVFDGSDGANFLTSAQILAAVDGTPGTNDMPGRLMFGTTADGAGGTTERLRIDSSGNVLVVSAGGLGYGTGAGGTVTQATSKTTGVTLNKPVGQITMNNAALGAAAFATFQLTNSMITPTDLIAINIKSPVSGLANYRIQAGDIGAGYCWISLQNVSAGSLSDAVVINFAIIKCSAA